MKESLSQVEKDARKKDKKKKSGYDRPSNKVTDWVNVTDSYGI